MQTPNKPTAKPTAQPSLADKASFILEHLAAESRFLDKVIESSLEMQTILRISRRPESDASQVDAPSQKAEDSMPPRIAALQQQLEQDFSQVNQGRQQMLKVIKSVDFGSSAKPTAMELAKLVHEPQKSLLTRLRSEIRSKFNRIQAICMGNQAVLVYTLDFYNRLLAGLSQQSVGPAGYDASGASMSPTNSRLPGNIVRTHC